MTTQQEKKEQGKPTNRPAWIDKLCEALAEGLEDDRLPGYAHEALASVTDHMIYNRNQRLLDDVRLLLPVTFERAINEEADTKHDEQQDTESEQEAGSEEEFAELLQSLIAPLRKLLDHDCMDAGAASQITDGFLLLMNEVQSGNQTAADITEVAIKGALESLRQKGESS